MSFMHAVTGNVRPCVLPPALSLFFFSLPISLSLLRARTLHALFLLFFFSFHRSAAEASVRLFAPACVHLFVVR